MQRDWRVMLLSACTLALVCLALCGAPRLIASPEGEETPATVHIAQAYLTAADDAGYPVSKAEGQDPARLDAALAESSPVCALRLPGAQRDANGHVLTGKSFMRAVYQAFALGDGFV